MEENNKKTSYITGILGAILGGAIASIPWVLMYVYGNMILSLLAVIIGAGAFYGYKLCKGKMDTKLPIIIMIISIVIVTIITFAVIPLLLLKHNGYYVSMENLKALYQNSEWNSAIIRDYVISVVFTLLGASAVTSSIKKQLLANSENITLDLSNQDEQQKLKNDAIEVIKPIFEKYNAVDKENTMTKEEVLAETEGPSGKIYFSFLKNSGIIKKVKGKYYYSVEDEDKKQKRKVNVWFIITTIILVILAFGIVFQDNSTNNSNQTENTDLSFQAPQGWVAYQGYSEETGWTFYKSISAPTVKENNEEATNTIDYSQYPAMLNVVYSKNDEATSIDELKTDLETYIKEKLQPEEYSVEKVKTSNGYDAVKIKLKYNQDPEEVSCYYYIYTDGKLAIVTGESFNLNDEQILEKDVISTANSFKWK